MKKILFVLTSHNTLGTTGRKTGAYLGEVTHPFEELREAGYEIDFVSPQGGAAPLDGVNLEDPINKKWMSDAEFKKKISTTLTPSEVEVRLYAGIFFAGGHGTMFDFPQNTKLAEIAAQIYESGGVVGAVCHGPSGLVNIKLSDGSFLVSGKQVSAFSNSEEEAVKLTEQMPFLLETKLKERGALYSKSPNFEPHSVSDQRLVTGQNPASAADVARKMIAELKKQK